MTLELSTHHHVHFVGVAGIGMSALARLLVAKGFEVSGSDIRPGPQGRALAELGIRIFSGHQATNIQGADLVVISSAVPPDNGEVVAALNGGIPVVKRAELLGAISNEGRGIAVAGTHGKTSTSALIAHVLIESGLEPTVLIGGMSSNMQSNARIGTDLVVVEADEYDASFLQLRPSFGIITNVEADHLDFYGTLERLTDAFTSFARAVSQVLIVCADDPGALAIEASEGTRRITYGLHAGDWQTTDIRDEGAMTSFRALHDGTSVQVRIGLAGEHNVRNCLAALAVAHALGIPAEQAASALSTFNGVERRFEIKGERGGVLVMDDYAHHPTEIRVNLEALKHRYSRPVRLVFQPHTYSRTEAFLQEFAQSFDAADEVYLLDIYASREKDTRGISGSNLAEATRQYHPRVQYTATREDTLAALLHDARSGDIVMTMGAGDVYEVGNDLLEALSGQ